jgi:asparagine synthetase B (glutamine-hydrolysing)
MSGLIAVAGGHPGALSQPLMEETINRPGALQCTSLRSDEAYLCAARHPLAPGYEARSYEDDQVVAVYAGDVVNYQQIDWHAIQRSLRNDATDFSALTCLRGAFALAVYDVKNHILHAVTDPFAWQPLYYQKTADGVVLSTALSTFLNLPTPVPPINRAWIHQLFFFNYSVGSTTPLTGVCRLPPGTVTSYHSQTREIVQREYRSKIKRAANPLAGRDAISQAVSVFNDVVPRYFSESTPSVIGLSAGLDCRTLLAALPDTLLDRLESFTYGIPHSSEIMECDGIAKCLKLKHNSVPLGDEFRQSLPELARETVFLSDGLQNINRSHLLHVYRSLNRDGDPYSTLVTGVSGDHIFRDHILGMGNVPHMMSGELARQHRTGRSPIDYSRYREFFHRGHDDLADSVESTLDEIERSYGNFGDPESYLTYLMYVVGPSYFSGEAAIANSVSTFRNPYWDPEIVELGYQLKAATVGASESMKRRDKYREIQIQAAVIAENKRVGQVAYQDMPISAFADGRKTVYQMHRTARKIRSLLQRKSFINGENWSQWYGTVMKEEIATLLGDDSRVREYVMPEFIESAISNSDVHWLGKLMTAEYTLRLIENRWVRIRR